MIDEVAERSNIPVFESGVFVLLTIHFFDTFRSGRAPQKIKDIDAV